MGLAARRLTLSSSADTVTEQRVPSSAGEVPLSLTSQRPGQPLKWAVLSHGTWDNKPSSVHSSCYIKLPSSPTPSFCPRTAETQVWCWDSQPPCAKQTACPCCGPVQGPDLCFFQRRGLCAVRLNNKLPQYHLTWYFTFDAQALGRIFCVYQWVLMFYLKPCFISPKFY